MTHLKPSRSNPYKLVYDNSTSKIGFVPQTDADKIETQKLVNRLNAGLKDTTSQGAINAKAFSDNLKAQIEKRALSKKC